MRNSSVASPLLQYKCNIKTIHKSVTSKTRKTLGEHRPLPILANMKYVGQCWKNSGSLNLYKLDQ